MSWITFILFLILGIAVFFPLTPWSTGPRPVGAGRWNLGLAIIYLILMVLWVLSATGALSKF